MSIKTPLSKYLELEWSPYMKYPIPSSIDYQFDEKNADDYCFSRTPKRRNCISKVEIKTFNCWNIDNLITANQVKLYVNVIKSHFDNQTNPTIFFLQGIQSDLKNELFATYPDNIVFSEIYGVNTERIDLANITYVPDYKDRYCATIWSDDYILTQSIIPSYMDKPHLGRRTSDWLVLQYKNNVFESIAITNIWLSPQKRNVKKEKPIHILQSILEDAEILNKDFGWKIIVAGTFNMIPDIIREYVNDINLEHINIDKTTIQYISQKMLEKPRHVDYALFWGFTNIIENIIAINMSYHSMVHYACQ